MSSVPLAPAVFKSACGVASDRLPPTLDSASSCSGFGTREEDGRNHSGRVGEPASAAWLQVKLLPHHSDPQAPRTLRLERLAIVIEECGPSWAIDGGPDPAGC